MPGWRAGMEGFHVEDRYEPMVGVGPSRFTFIRDTH